MAAAALAPRRGAGRRETSPAWTFPVSSISTAPAPSSLARTRSSTIRPTPLRSWTSSAPRPGQGVTTLTGTRLPPKRVASAPPWRRKSTTSRRRYRDAPRPLDIIASLNLNGSPDRRRTAEAGQQDHRPGLWHGCLRRDGRQYAIENWCRIPTPRWNSHVNSATATRSLTPTPWWCSISQSGETMDTLMAVRSQ